MGALITVLPVFFPILAGICLLPVKFKERKQREQWVLTIVVLNAIFALFAIWSGKADAFTLFHFSDKLSLELRMDGLSKVFGTMVSILWILTTIYGFEYMTHEGHEDRFFAFFTMTFGVVLGIAFSGNFLTMYLFYEFLTLVTLPLVMHAMDNKARHAGKMYILYMMFGAALAFIGFVFVYCYGTSIDFVPGGVLNPILVAGHETTLQLVFIAAFFGFGVKAAVFPLYRWLPKASVAPTPVTALLHAVAVVKSGIFAIIRLTYYSFGTDFLVGTVAQNVMLVAAAITIVFGSTVALRTPHIKRRFAYSTVSNLSYIIFGIALMTLTQGNPAELLKVLNRNPDCAFLVFLGEQEISETFAKEIVECGNAMVSVPTRPDSAQNCRLMRNNGLLYAVHAGYGEEDADRMLDDSWLKKQLFLHPQCAFICADWECRREIRQKVYDHVVDVRMRQKYPVLLMEVREDLQMIDHIISEKRI